MDIEVEVASIKTAEEAFSNNREQEKAELDRDPIDIYRPVTMATDVIRACYLTNSKPCGSKFFVSHYSKATLTYWGRSGHVRTGRGNLTEKAIENEEKLMNHVAKQIQERKHREGNAQFSPAALPLKFPDRASSKKRAANTDEELGVGSMSEHSKQAKTGDIATETGFTLNLAKGGKKWYIIAWHGNMTGCLSFGALVEGTTEKKGPGTTRPKQFDTVREAKKYFEGYVKKKRQEDYTPMTPANRSGAQRGHT
jgi:hypothetical protein